MDGLEVGTKSSGALLFDSSYDWLDSSVLCGLDVESRHRAPGLTLRTQTKFFF